MINKSLLSLASATLAAAVISQSSLAHAAGCQRTRAVPPSREGAFVSTSCRDATASAEVQFISILQAAKSYLLRVNLRAASALSASNKLLNGASRDIPGCFISDGNPSAASFPQSSCIVQNTNPAVNYKLTAGNGGVE
jgi:hypothetical protein